MPRLSWTKIQVNLSFLKTTHTHKKRTFQCVIYKLQYLCRVLESVHASYVESVPFRQIAIFTGFQFAYLLLCFGVTWIPIFGILFPLPFFLLISIREHILPKFFHGHYLRELDAAEYDEVPSVHRHAALVSFSVYSRSWFLNFFKGQLFLVFATWIIQILAQTEFDPSYDPKK